MRLIRPSGTLECPDSEVRAGRLIRLSFAIRYPLRVMALYRGWEAPLAKEPTGVYKHDGGRPPLRRKIAGKSRRELRDLGRRGGDQAAQASAGTAIN